MTDATLTDIGVELNSEAPTGVSDELGTGASDKLVTLAECEQASWAMPAVPDGTGSLGAGVDVGATDATLESQDAVRDEIQPDTVLVSEDAETVETAEVPADMPAEPASPRRHRRRRPEDDQAGSAAPRAHVAIDVEAGSDEAEHDESGNEEAEHDETELATRMAAAGISVADASTIPEARTLPDDGMALEEAPLEASAARDASTEADERTTPGASAARDESVAPEDALHAPVLIDAPDDPDWREYWPDNKVLMVARLLPRLSAAPALDGVPRTRMELSLVEQHGGEFGTVGNLPIFVMPGVEGLTPIADEIKRALKQKRRLEPFTVELQGILRQLRDRDMRYASARNSVLMGVEVHHVKQIENEAEQYAYWRGRAVVSDIRRYEHKGMPYQRVTAVVAVRQRKPHMRGVSVMHVPVDFLVAPDHPHADRFERIGQRLLIEGNIGGDVHRMSDNHPDLEGLEPRRRAQLQVLRESVVTVAMGEFPDETAERDYDAWVRAGRPRRPTRQPREAKGNVAQRVNSASVVVETNGHANVNEPSGQDLARGAHAPSRNGHAGVQSKVRKSRPVVARTKGVAESPG